MSNRHTLGALFGVDLLGAGHRDHFRPMIGDMVVTYLTTAPEAS